MTVNNTTLGRVSYLGNGSTTVFSVPFVFTTASTLEVRKTVIATGVETIQTLTTHYTVSGGGTTPATGSITFLTAPASTERVTIRRIVPNTQTVDYVENDTLPAAVQEGALDKLTLQIQDLKENIDRAVLFTPGSGSSSISIGSKTANWILTWDASAATIISTDPASLQGATGPQGPAGVGVPTGGTTGQVLSKINNTDYNTQWVTPSAGGGDLVKIQTITLSSSANATFTTGFDSSIYNSYILTGVFLTSVSAVDINMTWSTDGGSSFLSTNYSISTLHNYGATPAESEGSSSVSSLRLIESTFGLHLSRAQSFSLNIFNVSSFTPSFFGTGQFTRTDNVTTASTMAGSHGTTSLVNGIRLAPSSGTFASGYFTLYGVKK